MKEKTMKNGMNIGIAIAAGLAIGFGGWYVYSQYKKRKEAQKLGMGKATFSPNMPIAIDTGVKLTENATQQSLVGTKPKRPIINVSPDATTQSLASQTSSRFDGQEMVTRYQKPFWTVGG